MVLAVDERKTIMGDYSTLEMLDIGIGENTSAKWLDILVNDLNKFSGSKNMDEKQAESLAYLIAQEYKDVKYSIIQLFFYKFKCGYFGKFWGKVDPMVITCALKDFVAECEAKKQSYLNEEYFAQKSLDDEQLVLRHKAESQWWRCQSALSKYCQENELPDPFSRMEFVNYDKEDGALLFKISKEDYELVEGQHIRLFSSAIGKYFPQTKVQYKITEQATQEKVNPITEKENMKKKREVEGAIESAKRIVSNSLGLEKDVLEQMEYSFKLRYKYSPEDYLAKHHITMQKK